MQRVSHPFNSDYSQSPCRVFGLYIETSTDNSLIQLVPDAQILRRKWRIIGGFVGSLVLSPLQNTLHGLPLLLSPEQVHFLISNGVGVLINDELSHLIPTAADIECQRVELSEQMDTYNAMQIRYAAHMTKIHLETMHQKDTTGRIQSALNSSIPPSIPVSTNHQSNSLPWYNAVPVDPGLGVHLQSRQNIRNTVFLFLWRAGWFISSGSKFGGDFLLYPRDPSLCHAMYIVKIVDSDQQITGADIVRAGRLATFSKKIFMYCYLDLLTDNVHSIPISWVK
ncbi:tRNA-splicing endonuclease subunit Sen34 [Batrachochytrium dendrobatidis]